MIWRNSVLVITVLVVALLPAVALAQSTTTCVSPGPCSDFGIEIEHLKRVGCGPWPELPQRFVISAEVPLGLVPLAGDRGYSRIEQCEMLRRALTGEP